MYDVKDAYVRIFGEVEQTYCRIMICGQHNIHPDELDDLEPTDVKPTIRPLTPPSPTVSHYPYIKYVLQKFPHPLSADEDLEDLFRIDLGVFTDLKREYAGENVDEKVKELLFLDFTVCLLWVLKYDSASRLLS
ncbi:hypothetical protein EA472_22355 [Natrarchaeobius oligotrophus]|uniref:Uncharacterized protein n=1 Tax=Natrarchaeobius chitinivorans TaxID=1679083 RepID=A0A3N6LV65_NATCH|nr:hypothetical protein EA472_22355 [Natrarchaeobius chitinivorans]